MSNARTGSVMLCWVNLDTRQVYKLAACSGIVPWPLADVLPLAVRAACLTPRRAVWLERDGEPANPRAERMGASHS